MPLVVGISLRQASKVYHFNPGQLLDLEKGDFVIVETSRGQAMGRVVCQPHEMPSESMRGELKPVLRRATSWDAVQRDLHNNKKPEVLQEARAEVVAHGLPMKVVDAEYNFDGSHLTVYFASESRVDFRKLVRELSKKLVTSVEMRQIGVRDEAKLMDGHGRCGYRLCCAAWLQEFEPVSIKLAKQQGLPLNPAEISGVCGRLLCCLAYESSMYDEALKSLPKRRTRVMTRHGEGTVERVHPLRESVTIRLDNSETWVEVPANELVTDTEPETQRAGEPEKPRRRNKGHSRRRAPSQ
jgi:cell fate regulator YaaT (PSP1 superfamily)